MEASTSHFLLEEPHQWGVVFTGALDIKVPACPALLAAVLQCSSREGCDRGWEKSMIGRLLLDETAAMLHVVSISALSSYPGRRDGLGVL